MKKVIMIGAGQIGRGFIGMELERAGYHVLFADVNQAVIDDINSRGSYTVYMLDTESVETRVSNISAISSLSPDFPACFADAAVELVCTSVGQTALPKIAPAIAAGIGLRQAAGITVPMNIIAVENAIGGTTQLKAYIDQLLTPELKAYCHSYVGFPDSAVDRIIPPNKEGTNAGDVVVERYFEWDVEKAPLKAEILPVDGLHIVDDLTAYLERKLFTLNGPNAVTACYGYLKGYTTIQESLDDPEIYAVVWGMMEECGAMLEKRHGFTAEQMLEYRTKLMARFRNPYIIDSVTRVGREPIRKLSPNDRIIAPMNHANGYGIATPNYHMGVAAVLLYDNPDDAQSQQIQQSIAAKGLEQTICDITELSPGADALAAIVAAYGALAAKYGK